MLNIKEIRYIKEDKHLQRYKLIEKEILKIGLNSDFDIEKTKLINWLDKIRRGII